MTTVNSELKRLIKSYFKDKNKDSDPVYEELQHRSLIESLDARCETLKRRNNMYKNENELLRKELATLQSLGTPLQDKYANSKCIEFSY